MNQEYSMSEKVMLWIATVVIAITIVGNLAKCTGVIK